MSDDLDFIVIDDIPEYIFYVPDEEELEGVIPIKGEDGSFKYEKVAELPETGEDGVLYLVPKPHETQTASGNPISINVTEGAGKLSDLKLDGDASQQTYSGKNLLENKATTRTYLGVTLTKNDDGSITLNGTSTGNAQFYLTYNGVGYHAPSLELPAGTYTLNGLDNNGVKFECNYTVEGESGAKYSTGTFSASAKITCGIYVTVQNGSTVNNLKIYPQLEQGSSVTSYEPFVGGTASPNPDYPQEIQTVTGENVVKVVGKNLLEPMPRTTTSGGINYEWKENGDIVISNTATGTSWFRSNVESTTQFDAYLVAGTYAFSVIGNTIGASFRLYDETGTNIVTTQTSTSFTLTEPTKVGLQIRIASGTATNITVQVQLELGNSASSYEAFTSQSQEINLGKNLLTPRTGNTQNGMTGTVNADGSIHITGTATAGWANIVTITSEYLPSGTYTFSTSNDNLPCSIECQLQMTDNTWATMNARPVGVTPLVPTKTYNLPIKSIRINTASMTVDTEYDFTIYPMIERGTTPSGTYAPYFPPLELAKIGTYQDRIHKDGEKWYIEKQIGKVVLDGSESDWFFFVLVGSGFTQYYHTFAGVLNMPNQILAMSDYFIGGKLSDREHVGNSVYTYNGGLAFNPYTSDFTDLASFKSWLGTHNTTVYYALANPVDEEITNEALIAQLEAILAAQLAHGQNNISNTATGNNLAGDLELSYYEYDPTNKYNKWLWLDDDAAYEQM